jgi:hypothetical protein
MVLHEHGFMKNDLGIKADDKEAMKANLAAQVRQL